MPLLQAGHLELPLVYFPPTGLESFLDSPDIYYSFQSPPFRKSHLASTQCEVSNMPHSTSPSFDVPQSTTTPAVPLSEGSVHTSRDPMQPSSNTDSRGPAALPPEALAFAGRMFDAARNGDLAVFQQAVPAGLPVNLTNEKGDTLVSFPFDSSLGCCFLEAFILLLILE